MTYSNIALYYIIICYTIAFDRAPHESMNEQRVLFPRQTRFVEQGLCNGWAQHEVCRAASGVGIGINVATYQCRYPIT